MITINNEPIDYPEIPEPTGKIIMERVETDEGILYKATLEGGNTVGILDFLILGYKSLGLLICRYLGKKTNAQS